METSRLKNENSYSGKNDKVRASTAGLLIPLYVRADVSVTNRSKTQTQTPPAFRQRTFGLTGTPQTQHKSGAGLGRPGQAWARPSRWPGLRWSPWPHIYPTSGRILDRSQYTPLHSLSLSLCLLLFPSHPFLIYPAAPTTWRACCAMQSRTTRRRSPSAWRCGDRDWTGMAMTT